MGESYILEHIGFVVPDLDEGIRLFSESLGLTNWETRILEPTTLDGVTVYGKRVSHSFGVATAQLGSIKVELITPLAGESVYVDFLREKGGGFHHICLSFCSEEALRKMRDALTRKGGVVTQTGRSPRVSYCYIENQGLVLELLLPRPGSLEYSRGGY